MLLVRVKNFAKVFAKAFLKVRFVIFANGKPDLGFYHLW